MFTIPLVDFGNGSPRLGAIDEEGSQTCPEDVMGRHMMRHCVTRLNVSRPYDGATTGTRASERFVSVT